MHEGRAASAQASPDGGDTEQLGYLGKDGKVAIEARFAAAGAFSEGRAIVVSRGNLGMIDAQGNVVVQGAWLC